MSRGLGDVYKRQVQKEGRQGKLTFYIHTLVCRCEGELIVTAETVLIRVGDDHDKKVHNC